MLPDNCLYFIQHKRCTRITLLWEEHVTISIFNYDCGFKKGHVLRIKLIGILQFIHVKLSGLIRVKKGIKTLQRKA